MALRNRIARWLLKGVEKASPTAEADMAPEWRSWGAGPEWAPTNFGEYYAKSALIYSAVKLRADTIIRPPLVVYEVDKDGSQTEVDRGHPLAELMRRVNPLWTRGDLWRATSTYLDLWGSAFWVLTKASPKSIPTEIWPVRPDRMRIVPNRDGTLRGFIYGGMGHQISLMPEEVIWFRHFNPLTELAGLSPVAPLRLSADMAQDALTSNRNLFKNGLLFSNVAMTTEQRLTDAEVDSFYRRLKARFAGPANAWRPIILGAGLEAKNLGFSPKDMEHLAALRWGLEDVCRVYGVPQPLLADLERATYSNIREAQQIFWRNTIVPYLIFLQEEVNEMLLPQFGENLRVEFDLSQIEALQENMNEVALRQRADVLAGILTVNEVRAERGLDPVPWGDAFWLPLTMMPVGDTSVELPALPATESIPSNNGHRLFQRKMWSDEVVERVLEIHVRRLGKHETQFRTAQKELFSRQKRDVLARLKGEKSVKQFPGESLFAPEEWLERWVSTGKPLFLRALLDTAEAQVAQYGLGITFNVGSELVQSWLTNRTEFWASRVNEDTAKLLMAELEEAAKLGESIPLIQERVEKVFRFSDSVRSERIARTEMLAASNRGALEAYRESGVVEEKIWLTVIDERTRDAHLEAHRQTVSLDAQFLVGGESIDGPGEGSPGNSINCRCGVAPIVKRQSRALNGALAK